MTNTYSSFFKRPISILDSQRTYEQIDLKAPDHAKYFAKLFSGSFKHHVTSAYLADVPVIEVDLKDDERAVKEDDLTAHFIRYLYSRNLNGPKDSNSNPVEFVPIVLDEDRLVDEQAIDAPKFAKAAFGSAFSYKGSSVPKAESLGSNRVSYLIGGIGSGKSLLLTWVLDYFRKTRVDSENWATIPIYIDYDAEFFKDKNATSHLKTSFFDRLYELLEVELHRWPDPRVSANKIINQVRSEHPYATKKILVSALVRHCASQKIRFCLLLDNVDAFHYSFSKYSFSSDGFKKYHRFFVENVSWLKNTLCEDDIIGWLGLACVIALRDTVHSQLEVHMGGVVPRTNQTHGRIFRLTDQLGTAVLSTRIELFRKSWLPVSLSHLGSDFNPNYEFLKNLWDFPQLGESSIAKEPILSSLVRLGQHKHRSLVDFILDLRLEFGENGEVFSRLFKKPPPILRVLFMADARKRFSQAHDHFPNIFLCDAMVQIDENFVECHVPHRHTYWLKFLLLKFVQNQPNSVASLNEIIEVFMRCGYEKTLIVLSLGSLASENVSACLKVIITDPKYASQNVTLTPRALTLLERGWFTGKENDPELIFNFDYLQLVVDDFLLSFPNFKDASGDSVFPKIYIPSDLSYLLAPPREHSHLGDQYLTAKTIACLHFLRILDASFSVEKKHLQPLFDEVPTADVSKRLSSIVDSFVAQSFKMRTQPGQPKNAITLNELNTLRERLWRDNSYDKHFENYFASKILVQAL